MSGTHRNENIGGESRSGLGLRVRGHYYRCTCKLQVKGDS